MKLQSEIEYNNYYYTGGQNVCDIQRLRNFNMDPNVGLSDKRKICDTTGTIEDESFLISQRQVLRKEVILLFGEQHYGYSILKIKELMNISKSQFNLKPQQYFYGFIIDNYLYVKAYIKEDKIQFASELQLQTWKIIGQFLNEKNYKICISDYNIATDSEFIDLKKKYEDGGGRIIKDEYECKANQLMLKELKRRTSMLSTIASLFYNTGDFKHAEAAYILYIKLVEINYGIESLEASNCYFLMGVFYLENKYSKRSMACFQLSKKLRIQKLGFQHGSVADCYYNIGVLQLLNSKYEEARQWLGKCMKITISITGDQNQQIGKIFEMMAIIDQQQGNYKESMFKLQHSMKIKKKLFYDQSHPEIVKIKEFMNYIMQKTNNQVSYSDINKENYSNNLSSSNMFKLSNDASSSKEKIDSMKNVFNPIDARRGQPQVPRLDSSIVIQEEKEESNSPSQKYSEDSAESSCRKYDRMKQQVSRVSMLSEKFGVTSLNTPYLEKLAMDTRGSFMAGSKDHQISFASNLASNRNLTGISVDTYSAKKEEGQTWFEQSQNEKSSQLKTPRSAKSKSLSPRKGNSLFAFGNSTVLEDDFKAGSIRFEAQPTTPSKFRQGKTSNTSGILKTFSNSGERSQVQDDTKSMKSNKSGKSNTSHITRDPLEKKAYMMKRLAQKLKKKQAEDGSESISGKSGLTRKSNWTMKSGLTNKTKVTVSKRDDSQDRKAKMMRMLYIKNQEDDDDNKSVMSGVSDITGMSAKRRPGQDGYEKRVNKFKTFERKLRKSGSKDEYKDYMNQKDKEEQTIYSDLEKKSNPIIPKKVNGGLSPLEIVSPTNVLGRLSPKKPPQMRIQGLSSLSPKKNIQSTQMIQTTSMQGNQLNGYSGQTQGIMRNSQMSNNIDYKPSFANSIIPEYQSGLGIESKMNDKRLSKVTIDIPPAQNDNNVDLGESPTMKRVRERREKAERDNNYSSALIKIQEVPRMESSGLIVNY